MHCSINFKKINIIIAFYGLSLLGAEFQFQSPILSKNKGELTRNNRACIVWKNSKEEIEIRNRTLFCLNINSGNKFYIAPNIDLFIKKFKGSEEGKYLKDSKNIVFSANTIRDLYTAAKKVERNEDIYLVSTDLYELSKTTNMYFFYLFLKENVIANNCIFTNDELGLLHKYCFKEFLVPLIQGKNVDEEYIFLSHILKKDLRLTFNGVSLKASFPFLKIEDNEFDFKKDSIKEFANLFEDSPEGLYLKKFKKEIFSYACLLYLGDILEKINTKSLFVNSIDKNSVLGMINVYLLTYFLLFKKILNTNLVPYSDIHRFADILITNCYLPGLEEKAVKEYIYTYHDIIN